MKNAVILILLVITALGVMFGINFIIRRIAYPRNKRYLHCRIVAAMAVTMILLFNNYVLQYWISLVNKIIDALSSQMNTLIPTDSADVGYTLQSVIILNCIVFIIGLLVVGITKLIYSKDSYIEYNEEDGTNHLVWKLVRFFYSSNGNEVRLNERGEALYCWIKRMKWACLIIFIGELTALIGCIYFGEETIKDISITISITFLLVPAAVFLILEQFELMLEPNPDDLRTPVIIEDGNFTTPCDIDSLMERYNSDFNGDETLVFRDCIPSIYTDIDEIASAGEATVRNCNKKEILNVILTQLGESDMMPNERYTNALASLLNGKNVIFKDHPKGKFLLYLAAYYNYVFSGDYNLLVVCDSDSQVKIIKDILCKNLKKINGVSQVWKISGAPVFEENSNCLVLSVRDVVNSGDSNILSINQNFMRSVKGCLIIDSGNDMFNLPAETARLFNVINDYNREVQYVIVGDGMDFDSFCASKIYINGDTEKFEADYVFGKTGVMVWRDENKYKLQKYIDGFSSDTAQSIGSSYPLAFASLKYGISDIFVADTSKSGNTTFLQIIKGNHNVVDNYVGWDVNLDIIRHDDDFVFSNSDFRILLSYDTDYNFYEAFWKIAKYGGSDNTLIHIISPYYMLRDYLSHNVDILKEQSILRKLLSQESGNLKARAVSLLDRMERGEVLWDELENLICEIGWNTESVYACLKNILLVAGIDSEDIDINALFKFNEKFEYSELSGRTERKLYISLRDGEVKSRINAAFNRTVFTVDGNEHFKLDMLSGNTLNYILPSQTFIHDGEIYMAVSLNNGTVKGGRISPVVLYDYLPVSVFEVSKISKDADNVEYPSLKLKPGMAEVQRHILGYYSLLDGNNLNEIGSYIRNGTDLKDKSRRVRILEIELSGKYASEKSASLLASILNGTFKTLFPESWQNLYASVVVSSDNKDSCINGLRSTVEHSDSSFEDTVSSSIPKTFISDDGHDSNNRIIVIEYSCLEYGMIDTLYANREGVFTLLRDYLLWAKDIKEKQTYLNYGSNEIPEIFDVDSLIQILGDVVPAVSSEKTNQEKAAENYKTCSFCGKKQAIMKEDRNGRFICNSCNDQLMNENEIIKSFEKIKKLFPERYNVNSSSLEKSVLNIMSYKDLCGFRNNVNIVCSHLEPDSMHVYIENNAPRMATEAALIYECARLCQKDLILDHTSRKLKHKIGTKNLDSLMRGHAMAVEVDLLRRMGYRGYSNFVQKLFSNSYEYNLYGENVTSNAIFVSNPFYELNRLVASIINKGLTKYIGNNYNNPSLLNPGNSEKQDKDESKTDKLSSDKSDETSESQEKNKKAKKSRSIFKKRKKETQQSDDTN